MGEIFSNIKRVELTDEEAEKILQKNLENVINAICKKQDRERPIEVVLETESIRIKNLTETDCENLFRVVGPCGQKNSQEMVFPYSLSHDLVKLAINTAFGVI